MKPLRAIDPSVLRKVEPDLQVELIRNYLKNSGTAIQALIDSWGRRDRTMLVKQAHDLESGSAAVGAIRLTALLEELESCSKRNQPTSISKVLASIESNYAEVRAELEEILATRTRAA